MQVDAFTESAFKGNPAAVCFSDFSELDDEWLQALAAEFNISMTCYLIPIQQGTEIPRFHLRWFSPIVEVLFMINTQNFITSIGKKKKKN
jgi:PhzF family phenazine biosynthesis protein